jgi:hypothetical protein
LKKLLDLLRSHHRDVSLVLFILAGLIGVLSQSMLPARHGGERWNLAWNLAEHGSFANPLSTLPTGPTAGDPPLASVITAGLILLFRVPYLIYMSSSLLSILANAASATLLPRVSQIFFDDPVPGIFSAILWLFTMQVVPGWDTNYAAVGLLWFVCLTAAIFEGKGKNRALWTAIAGVGAGCLCLLNPSTLLVWLPWLMFLSWKAGLRNQKALLASGTIAGIAFVMVMGWCARNESAVGTFAVRTGLGLELYVSNNDCAEPTIMEEQLNGCFHKLHPNSNVVEAEKFRQLGEVAYDKIRTEDTKTWIHAHPGRFAELTLARIRDFWFPDAVPIPLGYTFGENFGDPDYMRKWNFRERRIAYSIWIVTLLSIPGYWLMVRDRRSVAWFSAASLAIYPLMYYITITEVRYRDPVLWLTLLEAGYFLTWMLGREKRAVLATQ